LQRDIEDADNKIAALQSVIQRTEADHVVVSDTEDNSTKIRALPNLQILFSSKALMRGLHHSGRGHTLVL
jgi:hypothetical protein